MIRSTINRRWLRNVAGGVLLAATAATPCWAQEPAAAEPAAAPAAAEAPVVNEEVVLDQQTVVTPAAQAVLDRMQDAFNSLDRYQLTAQITRDEVLNFGYKLQHTESSKMMVQRPNRMRVEVSGDIKDRTYIYNGSELTVLAPDVNAWSSAPAPATIGELVQTMLDAGIEMPLIDILYQGYSGDLTNDVRVGIVVGDSTVDGVLTDHLAFRQPDLDWQLWVEKGTRALPRKLVITTRYALGDPQYTAVIRWDTNPKFDAKTFSATPPAGATKIPMRTKLVTEGGAK